MRPRLLFVLATALAAACLWPLVLVFQWFGVNVATLEWMARTDALGLRVFPAFLMFVRPTLGLAAALTIPYASFLVLTSPPQRASGILMKAAVLQGGLAVLIGVTAPRVNATLGQMVPSFADRRVPTFLVAPRDFIALQNEVSGAILPPLAAIALCCAVVAVLARRAQKARISAGNV
jgi:hypothetical protein